MRPGRPQGLRLGVVAVLLALGVDAAWAPPRAGATGAACAVDVVKEAAPAAVTLGGEVEIRLRATARCDATDAPRHVVLLMDSSLDMGGPTMTHMRASVKTFTGALDMTTARVGLVAYAGFAQVLSPLTRDAGALAAASEGLFPRRGSDLASGLRASLDVLVEGGAGAGEALEAVVLLAGSRPDGDPEGLRAAAAVVRERGAVLVVIAYGGRVDGELLEALASSPQLFHTEGQASHLPALYAQLAPELGDVRPASAHVLDVLPANMDYVWGSGVPAPRTRGRELTWAYAVWPESGVAISYALEPREVGRHATNERAEIVVSFDRGVDVARSFPVPMVDVAAAPTPTAVPGPTDQPDRTATAAARPLPTATEAPTTPASGPVRRAWLPFAQAWRTGSLAAP